MFIGATRCTRSGSQHDIGQYSSEAQEGAADCFAHRTAGVVVTASIGGPGSAARTGGGSRVGGLREGRRNDRGSGGDGNGGTAFFNLVIDTSNERPQVGILYVVGKAELLDPLDRAREVLRRGEVLTLCVDDDGVPVIVLGDGGEDRLRSCTDLCGPEPAGGAGPAYSVIVVAPSKLTFPSGGGHYLEPYRVDMRGALARNTSTVDEPVTVLPTALVRTNGARVDHRDRIISIEGDG